MQKKFNVVLPLLIQAQDVPKNALVNIRSSHLKYLLINPDLTPTRTPYIWRMVIVIAFLWHNLKSRFFAESKHCFLGLPHKKKY